VTSVEHKFTFPDAILARLFVGKLCTRLRNPPAIYIDDCVVYVIDGDYQMERILQLAKSSSASHVQVLSPTYPSKPGT